MNGYALVTKLVDELATDRIDFKVLGWAIGDDEERHFFANAFHA
jgi:hypothetical protein